MRRATRGTGLAWWVMSCLIWTACIPTTLLVDVPARSGSDSLLPGKFIAGVHKVDITPIPGVPLGGYSIDGKASRGFWTRLYARALYLRDTKGTPLVLISTDLGAIPGGLGDEVTRLLHDEYGFTWISREHLVLAATHTHHGPGNFYTSALFNSMISPWTGFDTALFRFLARRIAFSVKQAHDAAQQADLLTTDASALEVSKLWKLGSFFRNRSLPAFLLNPRAPSLLDPNISSNCPLGPNDSDTLALPDGRACKAVRPRVELLAIRPTGSTTFLGVAAFVPVHPTVLPSRLEVYSSDLFGVADALLEQSPACTELGMDPVVAFFNGAEGDVSPTWTARNHDEVVDLGDRLATKVCDLLSQVKPVVDTTIHFRFDRVALAGQSFQEVGGFLDSNGTPGAQKRTTAVAGATGAPAVGGAEDGRSTLYKFLGFREGKTLVARGEQGPKSEPGQVEAMGINVNMLSLMRWTSPPPSLAPIAVYEIGDTAPNVVIVALPGEFTTQMGERVRKAVWDAIPTSMARPAQAEHVLLIGLANEYIGYFATPEEYAAQHYEGAMTLYGPASGPFLAHRLAELAGLADDAPKLATPWSYTYQPGSETTEIFEPKKVGSAPYFKDDGIADLMTRNTATGSEVRRDLPVYCWRDSMPRLENVIGSTNCTLSNPAVSVESKLMGQTIWKRVDQAAGLELVSAVTGVGKDATGTYHTDWCAVWLGAPDHLEPVHTRDFIFRVKSLDGANPSSLSFSLVDSEPDGWADERFLQHPADPLDPSFPSFPFTLFAVPGQCTVPAPS